MIRLGVHYEYPFGGMAQRDEWLPRGPMTGGATAKRSAIRASTSFGSGSGRIRPSTR